MSRQPLFPDSTKEAVDLAEMMDGGGHSKQRRENFAKTAQSKFFCNPVYVSFSSRQRNLIKTFQIESMIALITKMHLIFS